MREYKLPRKTLILWQCRSLAIGILLALLCSYFYFELKPFLIVLLIIAILFVLFTFLYLPLYFKSCKIRRTRDAVIIRSGVIFKNSHILPFSRLIYTQTVTSPVARLMGLKAITLKAARKSLLVPELSCEDADLLVYELENGEGS